MVRINNITLKINSMRELDVGDIVYHEITNDVFWVSGNYYVGFRVDIQLNMDMCYCVNKDTKGEGILIPEINLTHLPIPNHIDSGIVFTIRHINDLIEIVRTTLNSNTEKEAMSFITKAEKMRVRYINMY